MHRRAFLASLGAIVVVGCGDGGEDEPAPSSTAQGTSTSQPSPATATATPSPTAPPATPTPEPAKTEAPRVAQLEPTGFPIDRNTRLGIVTGALGSRVIRWGEGPLAADYSREDQPSSDPVRANRAGWNARTHYEYEGHPAADWYIPSGTPVVATMDGLATLLINTVSNPFDVYGVSREAYIGNPDRSRAPISPFPGPGGGQGVFVRIQNDIYRTDYAHLEVAPTVDVVDPAAFHAGYSPGFDYAAKFAALRDFRTATAVAAWQVRKGDLIGYTGDSGYSEAPHLHYAIRPAGSEKALCPTNEPGFENSGWLFR